MSSRRTRVLVVGGHPVILGVVRLACDALPDVELVALGAGGLKEGLKAGQLFIDMSTINPIVSQKIAKELGGVGVAMVDASIILVENYFVEGAEYSLWQDSTGQITANQCQLVGPVGPGVVVNN